MDAKSGCYHQRCTFVLLVVMLFPLFCARKRSSACLFLRKRCGGRRRLRLGIFVRGCVCKPCACGCVLNFDLFQVDKAKHHHSRSTPPWAISPTPSRAHHPLPSLASHPV
ncbi:hypothetical protein BJ508DRAFT_79339 [Ascobolus immersus RN42]|uniref:Secreted protein n=1 Tax=Ascobolus immersus RN42 TaxID=1160509 RepID=A0A3N4HIT2_ASCIM|nr:hypothetical protein BJ508DRAFT_79339 [Ascobolus immersus RN42]